MKLVLTTRLSMKGELNSAKKKEDFFVGANAKLKKLDKEQINRKYLLPTKESKKGSGRENTAWQFF